MAGRNVAARAPKLSLVRSNVVNLNDRRPRPQQDLLVAVLDELRDLAASGDLEGLLLVADERDGERHVCRLGYDADAAAAAALQLLMRCGKAVEAAHG